MSKARQSARQRHNWTRIDMREGGRIGFRGAKAGSGAKASQPDGFDKNARTKELMKTENLPFNIASRIAGQEQIRYREAQKNIERQGNNRGGRIGFSDVSGAEGEAQRKEREKNILQRLFGGLRKGFTNEAGRTRRQLRREARREARGTSGVGWYPGKVVKDWASGKQPVRRWLKDNVIDQPFIPGGERGPLREIGKGLGWDGKRFQDWRENRNTPFQDWRENRNTPFQDWNENRNKPFQEWRENRDTPFQDWNENRPKLSDRPNYDRVMNILSYLNPVGQKWLGRSSRTGENTGGRVNARTGLYNTGRGRELDAIMSNKRQFDDASTKNQGTLTQTRVDQSQSTTPSGDADARLSTLNRAQQKEAVLQRGEDLGRVEPTTTSGVKTSQPANRVRPESARAQMQTQSATPSGQETQEGAGETETQRTFTTPSGEEVEFWDGVSKPTRAMFPKGEQGDLAYAAALGTWSRNNPEGGDDDNTGGGDTDALVMPDPTDPQQQLLDQASTDPKLENVDAVKTDATILTGDEDIQKITDPTDVTPADDITATDLTAKTGTAEEGELTDTKDTVTYDATKAAGLDPTQAQTGTVDKDVEAGQAIMTKEAEAAERDAEQEAAAKAQKQDYEISDDAFVSDVTFREGVVVTDTDPAEQQQRQVQLGMPAPDGEAAQIINKYGFGNSKKPPRIVTGAKAKQQAAAQLAADHDLDPEVANQIMEDVEGFDVEGQSQESLGAVAALPKEALVSTQIENLVAGMEDGKPPVWARPAVAAVEQMMAARGLSASTVGRDALFNSIIQSAMPIAQSNATALQQRAAQNLSNEQQALIQDRDIAARFLEKNAEFKQQMNIANLSNDQQMRLANLTSRNQNESENLSARQQTEMANLNARLQTNLTSAKIAESMGVAQLSVDQQRAMQNAGMVANVDMTKFNAAQQIELTNSKFMQTMTMADLDNRQQAALQNATLQAQMDMTNASERTKASVANAQNYLQMNLTNVNNKQQATITDQQMKQQRLLSDQAAENTAKQFNAKSENQNNQFMVSMANQMEQFNKAQINAMEQFNVGEENRMAATEADQKLRADSFNAEQVNRIRQFDAELDFRADSWNAQNAQAIQQSNIEWRRKANTIDTAAQNAVNATNAQMQFGMTQQAQSALWQQLRDAAHFSHQDSQSAWDRKMNIANSAMGNETLMTHRDFQEEQQKIWDLIDSIMDSLPPGSIAPMNTNAEPDDEA